MTETREVVRWRELAVLVTILLAATALRTWRLSSVPPGLTHDEAGHGHDAIAILNGARPIYETVGYGREPLYDYWIAGLMAVGGRTRGVLRFSAVPLGLVTLLATFAWVRLAYDGTVALASVALQSVAFWSLSTGRQALRSSLLPALFTSAIFFFWRSIDGAEDGFGRLTAAGPRRWRLGLFALLIGATLYTYIPARVLWIIFPCFMVYLALSHRPTFRRVCKPASVALGLGLLLAVPLFVYLRSHPGAEQRLMMLDAPLRALMQGDPSVILNHAWHFLSGFFIPGRGDDFLAYTIPGRPVFGVVAGALFLLGLGICLARWRDPASAFSLIWFIIGVSPSLVTGSAASTTRSIAALPVTFLFPAIAIVAGARSAEKRWGAVGAWLIGLASCGLLLLTGISSICDYFVTWAESPHTRAAYQHTLVETATYLDTQSQGGVVGISTSQPYAPHDPYVFEVSLERRDLSTRWFDARRALLLPPQPHARLIVPSSASPPQAFAELPGLHLRERIELRPDDLDPWVEIYDWRPRATLTALLRRVENSRVNGSLEAALSSDDASIQQADQREGGDLQLPFTFGEALGSLGYDRCNALTASASHRVAFGEALDLLGYDRCNALTASASHRVTFGEALDFLGYDLRTPGGEPRTVAPGGEVELMTLWRVTNPDVVQTRDLADVENELTFFTHALDGAGNLIAQEDRLDAPAWSWQRGDVVAQVHRLTLPPGLPEEAVVLAVGVYRRADMARLSVSMDGKLVGDQVFLSPVDVWASRYAE